MVNKSYILPNTNNLDDLINRAKSLSGFNTKNEILVNALQLYIEYLEEKFSVTKKSFYELTKDLAGSVEETADLAHNKKRLEGFGI